ncbi:thermonuclease family protein [Paenochrobactrum glaciei]|uniref:TNase-like domain-containing protein n=1 Tax=Paenochrobactrum glaciei TaxID=486407 RepID=A0ABN1FXL4_9HYPH
MDSKVHLLKLNLAKLVRSNAKVNDSFFIVSVITISLFTLWDLSPAAAKPLCYNKVCVFDGDTISYGEERIRIANIDAPEISGAKCDAEKRLGLVAKNRLYILLKAGRLKIVRGDPIDGRKVDRYKRTLATILVNKKDVGEILIDEQLARPWSGKREPWCSTLKWQKNKPV